MTALFHSEIDVLKTTKFVYSISKKEKVPRSDFYNFESHLGIHFFNQNFKIFDFQQIILRAKEGFHPKFKGQIQNQHKNSLHFFFDSYLLNIDFFGSQKVIPKCRAVS